MGKHVHIREMRVTQPGGHNHVAQTVFCAPNRDRVGRPYTVRMQMGAAVAIFLALFVALFLLFIPSIMSGKQWRAAEDRARAPYG
jgi:hypothetical protein